MLRSLVLICLGTLIPTTAAAEQVRGAHWGYGTEDGPAIWYTLNEHYSACGEGRHQSPIDLTNPEIVSGDDILMSYERTELNLTHHEFVEDILDNGHTIQVTYDEKSKLTYRGTDYELLQFHFHTPSEHTLDGMHFPMEMHMVHASESGALAVLGVFFLRGEHNEYFAPIVENLPAEPGASKHVEHAAVDIADLLPESADCYTYSGSLTTPPCSEGVAWFVAREPVELSMEQIEEFTCRLRQNNRPPQPLNDRGIAKTTIR